MFAEAGLPHPPILEKVPNSRGALMVAEPGRDRGVYDAIQSRLFSPRRRWRRDRPLRQAREHQRGQFIHDFAYSENPTSSHRPTAATRGSEYRQLLSASRSDGNKSAAATAGQLGQDRSEATLLACVDRCNLSPTSQFAARSCEPHEKPETAERPAPLGIGRRRESFFPTHEEHALTPARLSARVTGRRRLGGLASRRPARPRRAPRLSPLRVRARGEYAARWVTANGDATWVQPGRAYRCRNRTGGDNVNRRGDTTAAGHLRAARRP